MKTEKNAKRFPTYFFVTRTAKQENQKKKTGLRLPGAEFFF